MDKMNRREFLRYSAGAAGAIVTAQSVVASQVFAAETSKFRLNVGYLPIADHLTLPVSHALYNGTYRNLHVEPYLCGSWDEILGKVDMGMLHAAFMLAPLAMYRLTLGSQLRCVLLGHTNGSVIAVEESIKNAKALPGKTIGIPHAKSTHRLLLYKYLNDRGIKNMNDVRLVKVLPHLTVENVKQGKIDGYIIAEPWGIKGVNKGIIHVLEYSKNILIDHACCLVMVTQRTIDRQPAAVLEWVRSLQDAGRVIHADPDKAGRIQQAYMKHAPDEIAAVVKNNMISYEDLSPDRDKLNVLHELALECGMLPEESNLDKLINGNFAG